mgnify:CR=1 FL=1
MSRKPKAAPAISAIVALAAGLSGAIGLAPPGAGAQTADSNRELADTIAAQVRDQGHVCDTVKGAERDKTLSTADEAVWILTCEDHIYRVRLRPDMAALIEQVD